MSKEPTRLGIREARAILPSLIDEAAAGAVFVLTVRGHDRCALVPLDMLPRLVEPTQPRKAKRRPQKRST